MKICEKCSQGYEPTEDQCPKCGTTNPAPLSESELASIGRPDRCAPFAIFCLWFACVFAYVMVAVAALGGLQALVNGEILPSLALLFIYTPATFGVATAFRLVIRYAKREP